MEIIYAGFGGQGVLTSGLVTAYIALKNDLEVLWSPAYGGQMRGGKAYSMVKFDKEQITDPLISATDIVVAMNKPSLDFCSNLKEDGLLIVNSSTVSVEDVPAVSKVICIPVDEIAAKIGSPKSANLVTIGVVVRETGYFDPDLACKTMCQFFEDKGKGKFNEGNAKAFWAGYNYIG